MAALSTLPRTYIAPCDNPLSVFISAYILPEFQAVARLPKGGGADVY